MANFNWKSLPRLILMKTFGALLAVIFLSIAVIFISYPVIALATTQGGGDAKVALVSDHCGKVRTGCRVGGLFLVAVEKPGVKKKLRQKPELFENIYCLYPAWPDQLKPMPGDMIRVWPVKQPLVGAPATDGWGWFIIGTILVVGLVMLEFTFLALTLS